MTKWQRAGEARDRLMERMLAETRMLEAVQAAVLFGQADIVARNAHRFSVEEINGFIEVWESKSE
jgi:hypothetical protein